MLEFVVLFLFCAGLLSCIFFDISILVAMTMGLTLFWWYGFYKGFSWKQLYTMSLEGVLTIKGMLMAFLLIGMLTGIWRASGTIPSIVCYASDYISPDSFVLIAFLLNGITSVLTGTSFGTVATMGVICISIAQAMGMDAVWVSGAIISGIYVGDRWSPVSTCALLVSTITNTDLYSNLRRMLSTTAVPLLITMLVYMIAGINTAYSEGAAVDVWGMFSKSFAIEWSCVVPAAVIILLAAFRVRVSMAMLASILSAVAVGFMVQGISFAKMFEALIVGYYPDELALKPVLSGGGAMSMLTVTAIVCIASCYAGLFKRTGLLDGITGGIRLLAKKSNPMLAMIAASFLSVAVACNQTLAVMLTYQLTDELFDSKQELAVALEDTVVVIAGIVPWCIAISVPLATIGAANTAIPCAVYLFLLPLWRLIRYKNTENCGG